MKISSRSYDLTMALRLGRGAFSEFFQNVSERLQDFVEPPMCKPAFYPPPGPSRARAWQPARRLS
jgi:hypothetical protein